MHSLITYIDFESLPDDMQTLLFELLDAQKKVIYARTGRFLLPQREVPLHRFPDVALDDERGVPHAQAMMGQELPPVITCGNYWLDGRHRVWAARQQAQATIKAIDVGGLLDPALIPGIWQLLPDLWHP